MFKSKLFTYFYSILSLCQGYSGQATTLPNYVCNQNTDIVEFTYSASDHSAFNSTLNCSLQQCYANPSNTSSCLLSPTPCFAYRTLSNITYCAPGIQCSLMEPCNNITYTCTSNISVCIVNSCCLPQAICLPVSWTNFCKSGTKIQLKFFGVLGAYPT
ncbi:unnamed protein product, partial [Rotaria sp. Silwood2]